MTDWIDHAKETATSTPHPALRVLRVESPGPVLRGHEGRAVLPTVLEKSPAPPPEPVREARALRCGRLILQRTRERTSVYWSDGSPLSELGWSFAAGHLAHALWGRRGLETQSDPTPIRHVHAGGKVIIVRRGRHWEFSVLIGAEIAGLPLTRRLYRGEHEMLACALAARVIRAMEDRR